MSPPGPPVLFREAPAGVLRDGGGVGSTAPGMEGARLFFSFVVAELTLLTLKTKEKNNQIYSCLSNNGLLCRY